MIGEKVKPKCRKRLAADLSANTVNLSINAVIVKEIMIEIQLDKSIIDAYYRSNKGGKMTEAKLSLGRTVMTRGIAEAIKKSFTFHSWIFTCLERHAAGDWGDLDSFDAVYNEKAVRTGERVLSSYVLPYTIESGEEKIWIITEWDRSFTTVLFPSDY